MNPEGRFTFLVLRPVNDMVLWLWRLERRAEFLYRPQFDRWLRPPLFAKTQKLRNARRRDEGLKLAEERQLPGEEEMIQAVIDELSKFTRENWLPGMAQRFGNTKTHGVLRGELTVLPDLPEHLRHGLFAEPGPTDPGCASPGRGRTRHPTSTTMASARSGSRSWVSRGPSSWRTSRAPRT